MLSLYEYRKAKMAVVDEEPEVAPKSRAANHTQRAPSRAFNLSVSIAHAVSALYALTD